MPFTSIHDLPYPEGTDDATVPADVQALAEQVEAKLVELIPLGVPLPYCGQDAPAGYLLCDGSAISRSTYSRLFAVLGTTYGAGNGSTTFNLPDLRGRVPVGTDDGAGRISSANEQGDVGGAQAIALAVSQIPAHDHAYSGTTGQASSGHTHGDGTLQTSSAGSHSHGSGSYETNNRGSHTHPMKGINDGNIAGGGSTSFLIPPGATGTNTYDPGTDADGSHDHDVQGSSSSAGSHSHGVNGTTDSAGQNHTHAYSGTTGQSGSDNSHSNLQPYQVFNWILRSGI